MASLNEIKTRISSVKNTQKTTSAMMMVSSAKLTKAQGAISNFLPYQQKLDNILTNVLSADTSYQSPFTIPRTVKKSAIVLCTSNSSLCGAFNSNVIKKFREVYTQKQKDLGTENILVYPIGKKAYDALKKTDAQIVGEGSASIAESPKFSETQDLAKLLISQYVSGVVDEVIVIYYHFVSTGTQELQSFTYLPFDLSKKGDGKESVVNADYIFEPSKVEILDSLIPTVLYTRLFAAFLDSNASEHAARMIAMQTATDNAKDLTDELTIMFNKQRQQAVTNELLDIIGGANALS